jgi:hypothetical protein
MVMTMVGGIGGGTGIITMVQRVKLYMQESVTM